MCPLTLRRCCQQPRTEGHRVRRHLLCLDFATRFVSAFFFRARQGATARRREGLRKGGAVYTVSAFGPDAGLAFRNVIAIRFGWTADGGGPGASAADGAALCQ